MQSEKKGTSGGSIDIVPEPEGKQNGTAPLQNPLSESKVTDKNSNLQENAEEISDAMPMLTIQKVRGASATEEQANTSGDRKGEYEAEYEGHRKRIKKNEVD